MSEAYESELREWRKRGYHPGELIESSFILSCDRSHNIIGFPYEDSNIHRREDAGLAVTNLGQLGSIFASGRSKSGGLGG